MRRDRGEMQVAGRYVHSIRTATAGHPLAWASFSLPACSLRSYAFLMGRALSAGNMGKEAGEARDPRPECPYRTTWSNRCWRKRSSEPHGPIPKRSIACSFTPASPFATPSRLFPICATWASRTATPRPTSRPGPEARTATTSPITASSTPRSAALRTTPPGWTLCGRTAWGRSSTWCPTTWASAVTRTPGGMTSSKTARPLPTPPSSTSPGRRRPAGNCRTACCFPFWGTPTARCLSPDSCGCASRQVRSRSITTTAAFPSIRAVTPSSWASG